MIVGVNLNSSGTPGHFVLVTGKDGDDFTIADPGHATRSSLKNDYANRYATRGFARPKPDSSPPELQPLGSAATASADPSALYISTSNAVTLLVIDPNGNRVGFDPETGTLYVPSMTNPFIANLVPAFLGVRLPVFIATTLIGIIPATVIFNPPFTNPFVFGWASP